MSVATSISAALKKYGRPITLRRATLNPDNSITNVDVTVYGHTTGDAQSAMTEGITQGTTVVQISNAEITAASWPGPPRKNDVLLFDNRRALVQSCDPKYLGSVVLAFELTVMGG